MATKRKAIPPAVFSGVAHGAPEAVPAGRYGNLPPDTAE